MKYFLYALLFLSSSKIIAQEFTVSGTLLDEQSQTIPYANILILNESGALVTGKTTAEDGSFIFTNVEANNYTLSVSFMGFETFTKEFELSSNKSFGSIVLKENSETLDEVNLVSAKPTLNKESDRLIFNVANTALSEGSLLEVLRNTPGVLILNNAITVKNTVPTVYINDKKVNLSATEITQLLENSPANTIKKVEVITNPPAKYDAESGAVLNIVMTRNLITGYRGNVYGNYTQGVFPRYNAGINQFYKTNKINVNLNYSFTQSKINRENDNSVNYLDNSGSLDEKWETNNNRNTTSKTHNVNLNFDYFLDDSNTLSFSANGLIVPFFDYNIHGQTLIFDNTNTPIYNFNSLNQSNDDKHNLGFNLDFVHRFKNHGKLTFNAHYTDYNYKRDQNVNSEYFFSNSVDNFNTSFNTVSHQATNIKTSQIDYILPGNDGSEFAIGVKSSNINTDSDITQFDNDTVTGNTILNAENSNIYDYEESIFAAYTSYDKTWGKLNFRGGLRLENTNIDGLSVSNNVENMQNYLELFPTLNLMYSLKDNLSLYTNYNRSISRPSYQLLNPFNFFLNDNTVVTGNPNLLPSFTNHYIIGSQIGSRYTVEAYYKDISNQINEIPRQDNINNLLIYSPTNIGNTIEFGFDFITYFNIKDNWSVYFVTSLYNVQDEAFIDNQHVKIDQWSNYTMLNNNFSFLKDRSLNANFTLTYVGKNQQGFQKVDSRLVSDLTFSKSVFKNKGTLSLAFADLFNSQDFGVVSKFGNQNNRNYTNLDNRYVKLGFNYKFGNTTLKTNERTKELKERSRLEK
ncbi:MAG: TonB-dependent receptor domain-containing protein [Lacinutrix venerupis]